MGSRRSLLDRVLKGVVPRPVPDGGVGPREIAPGLWALDRRLRLPAGPRLPCRTTIVRLGSGDLVVVSPPAPVASGEGSAIDALGTVAHVVVPNPFHYLHAGTFRARHPGATLRVAPGVLERVPELRPAEELGRRPPEAWSGELDLAILGPVRGISEAALFHRPTGTLILTDLAFHVTRFSSRFDRVTTRLAGIPRGFGPGRTSRLLLLRDRVQARRFLERVSEWPMRRIVVAHGEIVEGDARERFRTAFAPYLAHGRGE